MTRIMFDSDQPGLLIAPARAGTLVACYADLATPALIAELGRYGVWIDRGLGDPHNVATVADIEPGADSIASGVSKLRLWNAEHRPDPTAYHDRGIWDAVETAAAGIPHKTWVATLDGTLVPNGQRPAAVQFAGDTVTGFHADVSVVWDDSWHRVPAITSAVTTAHYSDGSMRTVQL